MSTQTAASHARYVPGFHFVTGMLVIANLAWTLYHLYVIRTGTSVDLVVIALSLVGIFWYARAFSMAVQDRVIRLEERLRLARLLPADMQSRGDEFTADQLIALRFASDEELPDLARRVLSDRVGTRGEIKQMIKQWRPDYMRA
ncbi:MAG: DUF6526 family protein [bacterium]